MATYLEIVNKAIQESGQDLDQLDSSNFSNPPTVMGKRWKTWAASAWKEIQMLRDDWEFKTGRATVFIEPAIYVEQVSIPGGSSAPSVGDVYQGEDTNYLLTITKIVLHSGTWVGENAKATLYFTINSSNGPDFKFNERFEPADTTPGKPVFVCKGWGRFNFRADAQVTDLVEVNVSSVMVQSTGGSNIGQVNTPDVGLSTLDYVDWAKWSYKVEPQAGTRGEPRWFTITPDGSLDFYPRPDIQYVLHFSYTKELTTLTNEDDTPSEIPSEYHDAIVWRTVMFYADFNDNMGQLARATKRFNFYRVKMEKRLMPIVGFAESLYND